MTTKTPPRSSNRVATREATGTAPRPGYLRPVPSAPPTPPRARLGLPRRDLALTWEPENRYARDLVNMLEAGLHHWAAVLQGQHPEPPKLLWPAELPQVIAVYSGYLEGSDRWQQSLAVVWWRRLTKAERASLALYIGAPANEDEVPTDYIVAQLGTLAPLQPGNGPDDTPEPPPDWEPDVTARNWAQGIICPKTRALFLGEKPDKRASRARSATPPGNTCSEGESTPEPTPPPPPTNLWGE